MPSARKKQRSNAPKKPRVSPIAVLGYLNFSSGEPNADFRGGLNQLAGELGPNWTWPELRHRLEGDLANAAKSSAGFDDVSQAKAVIRLVFDECFPAYRRHHADLLYHLSDADYQQPFFLALLFEAVLHQGEPWTETPRIVEGVLDELNDFLGYRPLAVLENGRQMQPYSHERFRPVPLYFKDVGAAVGPYQALIERTIQFFQETPLEIQHQAYFDWNRMRELAVDVRAHDHLHPANKRTNYMFGEWDPHHVDIKGYYDRFVIRKIILDALLNWMKDARRANKRLAEEEILFDASAVLCGTMLMASSISGSGPGVHDSTVTLTSLLPQVAHQRDAFYERLLNNAKGSRAKRLEKEARLTQQPFGHVRQRLNIELAKYGAKQVQTRHLAHLFARMGYSEASRRQSQVIPSASARFECEIQWRITDTHRLVENGELDKAVTRIEEIEDHLHRGIECGGLIDPWNILGFQGQFPLFTSREDAIHDLRSVELVETMERIFRVYAEVLGEAAAQGEKGALDKLTANFETLADWWDKFATTTVEDMPVVIGSDSVQSARHVAETLREWQQAGAAAGDISFWKKHINRFQSGKAYALVVDALLERDDQVASMALLMQWLNQAEHIGLDSGPYAIFPRLTKWMRLALGEDPPASGQSAEELKRAIGRMFAFLEANAAGFWRVPSLAQAVGVPDAPREEAGIFDDNDDDDLDELEDDEFEDSDEDELFGAAYDDVIFRDSADDGQFGDTVDEGGRSDDTSFDVLARYLEPRLQFLETIAELWQMAAAGLAPHLVNRPHPPGGQTESADSFPSQLEGWLEQTRRWQKDLGELRKALWQRSISLPSGDHDSNVEYDEQLQIKYYLLHIVIATDINCETAERALESCRSSFETTAEIKTGKAAEVITEICRGVLTRNAGLVRSGLPRLLDYLIEQPLLYVPLNNDGEPHLVRAAQSLQTLIRFLLTQMPRLGLLKETWTLLETAYEMERRSRPGGQAVTEFDQLFRTALRNSLDCVIRSSKRWRVSKRPIPQKSRSQKSRRAITPLKRRPSPADDARVILPPSRRARERNTLLIRMVSEIVRRYSGLWIQHSRTTRLSTVENLADNALWRELKDFIIEYGAELFHARMLTLGNLRAILHNGIDRFLDYLFEQDDPLDPMPLLEDIENGEIDPEQVVEYLELIYESVVDRIDRFVEYNTTTTQSDYGERFYCFLDFLRVEADYERDAWNLLPFNLAHEQLSLQGEHEAAALWEAVFRSKNSKQAARHIRRLNKLEKEHGMHLPALTDRIEERFVKPFAVNRMLSLVPRAIDDARHNAQFSSSFAALESEIQEYLNTTSGSGIDVAPWLRSLEKEVEQATEPAEVGRFNSDQVSLPSAVPVGLRTMQRQLRIWGQDADKQAKS